MDLTTAITSRHSTRAFTDEPVGRETITEIVALARRAPSWVDSQPWRVYAAIGAARERIARRHAESSTSGARGRSDIATMHRDQWASAQQRNMAGMSESLLALLGPDLERVTGEARASLFGAPALLYLTIPRAAPQGSLYDLGAFAQTLMLAARDRGLDTIPAYELVRYPAEAREEMGIPDDEILVVGVALGHRADALINSLVTDRAPVEQVLTIRD